MSLIFKILRLLAALKARGLASKWVFPRVMRTGLIADRSWLTMKYGVPDADELSKALRRHEAAFGLGKELAMRSRRYYSTMASRVFGPATAAICAGHSQKIQMSNYADMVERVASAKPVLGSV